MGGGGGGRLLTFSPKCGAYLKARLIGDVAYSSQYGIGRLTFKAFVKLAVCVPRGAPACLIKSRLK